MTLRRHMSFNQHKWNFCVIGDKGAMHFWCFPLRKPNELDKSCRIESPDTRPCGGGIEQHSLKPMYESQASHGKCWLLGETCYHDGSSLVAEELWIPLWMRCNESGDFEPLWRSLEREYRERFEREP